jgi:hypothetical protein
MKINDFTYQYLFNGLTVTWTLEDGIWSPNADGWVESDGAELSLWVDISIEKLKADLQKSGRLQKVVDFSINYWRDLQKTATEEKLQQKHGYLKKTLLRMESLGYSVTMSTIKRDLNKIKLDQ